MTSQIGKAGDFQDERVLWGFPPLQYRQVKIGKKWLQNRKDIKAEQYRSIVKQTMLLAAARMEARYSKRTKMKNEELRDPNMTYDMKV